MQSTRNCHQLVFSNVCSQSVLDITSARTVIPAARLSLHIPLPLHMQLWSSYCVHWCRPPHSQSCRTPGMWQIPIQHSVPNTNMQSAPTRVNIDVHTCMHLHPAPMFVVYLHTSSTKGFFNSFAASMRDLTKVFRNLVLLVFQLSGQTCTAT